MGRKRQIYLKNPFTIPYKMVYNVYMSENNTMTFEEFCTHMWSENCHERREHGEEEYKSLDEYVNNGSNKSFLDTQYSNYKKNGRTFIA